MNSRAIIIIVVLALVGIIYLLWPSTGPHWGYTLNPSGSNPYDLRLFSELLEGRMDALENIEAGDIRDRDLEELVSPGVIRFEFYGLCRFERGSYLSTAWCLAVQVWLCTMVIIQKPCTNYS